MNDYLATILSICIILASLFAAFCVGGIIGVDAGRQATQREAVEHGAGKWTVDPRTGAKRFEWITDLTPRPPAAQ